MGLGTMTATTSHQVSAQSDLVLEMSFDDFQDGRSGSNLEYLTGMILTTLNIYVTPMTPIKFQLNPTYGLIRIERFYQF